MLRNNKKLNGYKIQATDGEIGKVCDFYFNEHDWIIRYFIVETGSWISNRKVLISPFMISQPNGAKEVFPAALNRKQVKESPQIDFNKPVSLQQEAKAFGGFRWPLYWVVDEDIPAPENILSQIYKERTDNTGQKTDVKSHLRSAQEIMGYRIQAIDGAIGHVEDFVIDDDNWKIQFMVIDTRNWLPAKKVIIPSEWIGECSWAEKKVYVNLTQKSIKNSPKFEYATLMDAEGQVHSSL